MSVRTAADELYDSAMEDLKKSIKSLAKLAYDDIWGAENYDLRKLRRLIAELSEARYFLTGDKS